MGRSRGGLTTKIHVLVDANGNPITLKLTEGQAHDGKSARDAMREAVRETRKRFRGEHLVEVGIGCESCHGGCREHVESPAVKPAYEPRAPFLKLATVEKPTTAQRVNRICARCHQVLFSHYQWTWEGGRRNDATPGGSNINSGEARDLLLGGCAGALSCVDCHDPQTMQLRVTRPGFINGIKELAKHVAGELAKEDARRPEERSSPPLLRRDCAPMI